MGAVGIWTVEWDSESPIRLGTEGERRSVMANCYGNDRAYANPTKKFFVNMITRDITVEDSILDLLDNSVDSARRSAESGKPMSLAKTILIFHHTRFGSPSRPNSSTIKDNCGGMTS